MSCTRWESMAWMMSFNGEEWIEFGGEILWINVFKITDNIYMVAWVFVLVENALEFFLRTIGS